MFSLRDTGGDKRIESGAVGRESEVRRHGLFRPTSRRGAVLEGGVFQGAC